MQNDKEKFKKDFIRRLIKLSLRLIQYCESLKYYRFLWKVFDQIIDSTTSIGANSVEAQASSSRREFIKFFEIALKSANETIYWLLLIIQAIKEDDKKKEGEELLREVKEIANILGSSVLTLKGKKNI